MILVRHPRRRSLVDADDFTIIRQVDPAEAEAVLTVRVFIQVPSRGSKDQYHLARGRPRPDTLIAESVTVNPDGSITRKGTIRCEEVDIVVKVVHAHGRTKDGRGCGYRKSISIDEQFAGAVVVQLTMSWHVHDGERGSLEEELVIPWLGAMRKELAGGAWVAAEIIRAR